ncbi:MAG: mandelate racemase/muconate lactonizing enzyme family protein [Atopobiaceae bacterium]|jgi:galactonate dehydratase
MKITKVDIILMEEKPVDNPAWSPVLCRVYTDEGIYGDGEAALAYGRASHGAVGQLEDYARLVIGMNPLDTEVIWNKLNQTTFWGLNGGPVIYAAISAIDVACWDIKGKAFGAPVWQLLGGKMRQDLRCYASQLQFGWTDHKEPASSNQDYVRAALLALDEGYDALKYDFFDFDEEGVNFTPRDRHGLLSKRYTDLVVGRLAAVRDAVGPAVDIIVENHSATDVLSAMQLAHLMEPYDVFYFEEPCLSMPNLTRRVGEKCPLPLSQGERVYTRWQYMPYLEQGSVQVIQPDIGNCGGLTEAKKICDMAYAFDVSVQVHVCSSLLLTAAALQLEAVIPNFQIHEHHVYNRYDYVRRLTTVDYQPEDGKLVVPDAPGIGNEIAPYCFERGAITTVDAR